jgi:foldase protein PrsA
MVRYRPLVLILVVASLLLAGCGASPTETPVPTNTPEPTTPPRPTIAAPSGSLGTSQSLPERLEAALSHVKRVEGTTLATVDGEEITWEDYEPALRQALLILNQQHDINWEDSAMQQRLLGVQNEVLEQTVDRVLLRRIAADRGVTVSEEQLNAQIEHERTNILNSGQYTDWDAFLEKNGLTQEAFENVIYETLLFNALLSEIKVDTQGEQTRIAHIVVNDESTAQEVYAKLEAGEDFGALAAEYSIDSQTKDNGGDLGWFTEDIMSPAVQQTASTLQQGQFSEPMMTDNGYAIIMITERATRELEPRLLRQRQQEALVVLLEEAKAKAAIEYLVDFTTLE